MHSITQGDLLGNSAERDVHRECTGRVKARKYLRKSYYHRIECPVANFLTAFMWRRPLNSATLATTTHRTPERVSDETSIQVVIQIIDKCRIMIVQRELYSVRGPSWIGDWNVQREYYNNQNYTYNRFNWFMWRLTSSDSEFIQISISCFCLIIL